MRLQGISESTVVIVNLNKTKPKKNLTIFDNWNKAELKQILDEIYIYIYAGIQK